MRAHTAPPPHAVAVSAAFSALCGFRVCFFTARTSRNGASDGRSAGYVRAIISTGGERGEREKTRPIASIRNLFGRHAYTGTNAVEQRV